MSKTVLSGGLFQMDWSSDTTRERKPCTGGCGQPTTGVSKGKPMCLPCCLQIAMAN